MSNYTPKIGDRVTTPPDHDGTVVGFRTDGRAIVEFPSTSSLDTVLYSVTTDQITLAPVVTEMFANLYKNTPRKTGYSIGGEHRTLLEANGCVWGERIGALKITTHDGKPVSAEILP